MRKDVICCQTGQMGDYSWLGILHTLRLDDDFSTFSRGLETKEASERGTHNSRLIIAFFDLCWSLIKNENNICSADIIYRRYIIWKKQQNIDTKLNTFWFHLSLQITKTKYKMRCKENETNSKILNCVWCASLWIRRLQTILALTEIWLLICRSMIIYSTVKWKNLPTGVFKEMVEIPIAKAIFFFFWVVKRLLKLGYFDKKGACND